MAEIDLARVDRQTRYKVATGAIVPRPIAWLNTLNPDGGCNTAPFSFFNVVSPGSVVFGISDHPNGGLKDTLLNLRRHPEFVLHLPDEDTIEALVFTAVEFPPGRQEAPEAGLTLVPSRMVRVPRISEAAIAFEGRAVQEIELESPAQHLFIGRLLYAHVRDDLLAENNRIDWARYRPVGRLAGEAYCHVREFFAIPRPVYSRYLEDPEAERNLRRRPFPDG